MCRLCVSVCAGGGYLFEVNVPSSTSRKIDNKDVDLSVVTVSG